MSDAGLTERQKHAIREGNTNAVRRCAADEMREESLHGRLVSDIYLETDPKYLLSPDDVSVGTADTTVESDVEGQQMMDAGDDIAEFSASYSVDHHYDHLFDANWQQQGDSEIAFVGTGIKGAHHLTSEAVALIQAADKVLYCVADLVVERKIKLLNANCEDMYDLYGNEKPRRETYEGMVERCLSALNEHKRVCVVYYGHPGIFVWPSYKAIQKARQKGVKAYMLPAVSSLDCLFADVGFDPSRYGCQIFEATDFVVRAKTPDISAAVILLQIGCVGDLGFNFRGYDRRNMPVLIEYLSRFYGADYEAIVYEAAQYPLCQPRIKRTALSELGNANASGITTLYLPPKLLPPVDKQMLERLGLQAPKFRE